MQKKDCFTILNTSKKTNEIFDKQSKHQRFFYLAVKTAWGESVYKGWKPWGEYCCKKMEKEKTKHPQDAGGGLWFCRVNAEAFSVAWKCKNCIFSRAYDVDCSGVFVAVVIKSCCRHNYKLFLSYRMGNWCFMVINKKWYNW